jgi:hypothetical protein
MLTLLRDKVLREFGDQGADTLDRFFTQIEYTASLCISMLNSKEGIEHVIPEGGDDVVVVRLGVYEFHQVKTKDESQGPWTTADVLPILCGQYHRRKIYPAADCHFHFVSEQMADAKTALKAGTYGALYSLKTLLEAEHNYGFLEQEEIDLLSQLEAAILPRIQEILLDKHSDNVSIDEARELLHKTWIETDHPTLRRPFNVEVLETALEEACPSPSQFSTAQLRDIYDRLLLLIVRKIIRGVTPEERRICAPDVLNCRTEECAVGDVLPDLSGVPGRTLLEKKAFLGGFDSTELPLFSRQKLNALGTERELQTLRAKNLDKLRLALLDHQRQCRHKVCREMGVVEKPGPKILELVETGLENIATSYFPGMREVDAQFCKGLLWDETNLCQAWWHALNIGGGNNA